MDKAPVFVGIDVAKHRLDVHLRPSGASFAIDYREEEVTALIERLVALEHRAHGEEQDLDVEPDRPVLDVVVVPLRAVGDRRLTA